MNWDSVVKSLQIDRIIQNKLISTLWIWSAYNVWIYRNCLIRFGIFWIIMLFFCKDLKMAPHANAHVYVLQ